jgi:hypothetical protein
MNPKIESFGVIAGGQSGHFMSKNYDDQIDTWLEGKYYQLIHSQEELRGKELSKMLLFRINDLVGPHQFQNALVHFVIGAGI